METCSVMYQIHGRQVRSAAGNSDDAGRGVVGARPVVSALAVPDDPLDGIMQCLGAEGGFAIGTDDCWATGAWFDDFRGGSVDMSTHAGVDFLEMRLDVPDTTSALAAEGPTEAAATRAEAVPVPDRPVVTMNRPPSFSSSDDDDDIPWMSSGDSSSEDDAGDAHWLPCESKKSGGMKRRLRVHQQSVSGLALPAQGSVEVAEDGGGDVDSRLYRCLDCNTSTTPLWRAGPEGPKTLCNACGLRYSKLGGPTTAKRLLAAKPNIGGSAKGNNYPIVAFAGGATVVRKKRSVALRIG